MNNTANVIVNILVNSNSAAAGIQGFTNLMAQIVRIAQQGATQSATSFSSIFGANFFADLAANMVRSMATGFRTLVTDAIQTASRFESAFKGVGALARNIGIDQNQAIDAVRNLNLVRSGLITVADAATSVKNLLASGFNLDQSIELIRRFGDTAAFGRQAALSYGYAISSATEGIKNQNSILVDNAGLTTNLSVIMKNAGLAESDLAKVRTDATVRLKFYNGLIKETNFQQGDAAKLLDTTQGSLIRVSSAYERFLASLGRVVTESTTARAMFAAVAGALDFMGKNTGAVVVLTASVFALAGAVALTTTNFSALTVAQLTNAAAGSNFAKVIQTAILVLSDFRLAAALTAGEVALLSGGMLAIVGIIGALAYTLYQYASTQREVTRLTRDDLVANKERETALRAELNFLNQLSPTVAQNATEQARLVAMYKSLNPEAQTRIGFIQDETQKTALLIAEKRRLLQLSEFGTQAEGATRVGTLADSLRQEVQLRKELADQQQRFSGAASLAATGGREEGAAAREQRIREQAVARGAQLNNLIKDQADKTKEAAISVNEYSTIMGKSTDQVVKNAGATSKLGVEQNVLRDAIDKVAVSQKAQAITVDLSTKSLRSQIDAITELTDAADRAKARTGFVSGVVTNLAEQFVRQGRQSDPSRPFARPSDNRNQSPEQLLQDFLNRNPAAREQIAEAQRFDEATRALNDKLRPKEKKTLTDGLTDSLKRLNFEVKSFTDLTSKEFQMRFQREELERVKRDFEEVLNLRRELGFQLTTPLPTTGAGARAEIEQLERVRAMRDEILKTNREVRDADDQLLKARLTATAAVVDAQTRADTVYLQGIRKRRDEEQQLTADIAGELRRRADLTNNFVAETQRGQAEAFRDLMKEQTDRDSQRLKEIARIQLLTGELFKDNPIVKAASNIASQKPDVSPIASRIDRTNEILGLILQAIGSSGLAGSGGGGGGSVSIGNIGGVPSKRAGEVLRNVLSPSRFDPQLVQASAIVARQYGIDPTTLNILLKATLFRESSGRAGLTSEAGAQGYFQQLPDTQRRLGVSNPNDFLDSAIGAAKYLVGGFAGRGGLKKGGVPEAFATYFAGEGGGNRGSKTRDYVRDQTFVFNEAMKRTRATGSSRPTPPPARPVVEGVTSSQPTAASGGGIQQQTGGENADRLSNEFFGVGLIDPRLSDAARSSLLQYVEAMERFNRLGSTDDARTARLQAEAVGTYKLSQAQNVRVTQVEQLAVAERQLNDLLTGDAMTRREQAQENAIQLNIEYARVLKDVATQQDFIARFERKDSKLIGFLGAQASASRGREITGLQTDVFNLRGQAFLGGRDPQVEKLKTEREYFDTLVQVGRTEARIAQFRELNANENFVTARRRNGVLEEQLDIETRIARLQDDRATAPINQALREQVAIEEELTRIHRADYDALEQLARARVQIGDLTVYHQAQADAGVLQHIGQMKSLTDIYRDAKVAIVDKVWGGIDTLFGKLTGKLPIIGSILTDILSNITKLILNPLILRLLGIGGGGGASGGGGGGAAGIGGSLLGGLLGGLGGGGGGGSNATGGGSFAGGGGASFSGGGNFGNFLGSLTGGGGGGSNPFFGGLPRTGNANRSGLSQFGSFTGAGFGGVGLGNQSSLGGIGTTLAGTAAKTAFGGGGLAGIGGALAGLAPLLGMGLGAQLGAPAGVGGQLLGGFGGLLGGIAGAGALGALGIGGSALFGSGVVGGIGAGAGGGLGGIFGVGGILGGVGTAFTGIGTSLGLVGGAATALGATVVLAPIAAALLIGTYFLARNAKRRKEEKIRAQVLTDSKAQMQKIIDDLRAGRTDSASALSAAMTVRENYMQQVNQLKDRKTRTHAQQTVRELDYMIEQIKGEGRRADFRAAQDEAFVPTFATGGVYDYVSRSNASSARSWNDTRVAYMNPDSEVVLNRQHVYNLGGYGQLSRAGVRGANIYSSPVRQAQAFSDQPTPARSSGGSGDKPIMNVIVFGEKEKDALIAKSSGKAIIRVIKPIIAAGQDDGFLDLIGQELSQ